jgi:uncharacterized protein YaaQ
MKLLIAVVQDYDADRLLRAVTGAGIGATKISSAGGFLRMGNATVLMGLDDSRVETCLRLIRQSCSSRAEVELDQVVSEFAEWYPLGVHEVMIGGAVVFQLRVDAFHRLEGVQEGEVAVAGRGGR